MRLLFAITLTCLASTLAAQSFTYFPFEDTLYFQNLNRYRMYHIRGGDTVGRPVSAFSAERREWIGSPGEMELLVDGLELNLGRTTSQDTFLVTAFGRVLTINGDSIVPRGRHDLLLRLPEQGPDIIAGDRWSDTISFGGNEGPIGQHYEAVRNYHAVRMMDTLGGRYLEVLAEGVVHYRDGYWRDSTAGTYMWLDVSGPVTQSYYLDWTRAQMVATAWEMDLRGLGGLPEAPDDTIPAGLLSTDDLREITRERYQKLTRPMPGDDTTYTINDGAIFLHTAGFDGTGVVSGMMRADGLLGTATTTFADGVPVQYDALWTASGNEVRNHIAASGDSLTISGSNESTTSRPGIPWAVADYGMNEHLIPVLLRLPHTGAFGPLAIYRPYPDKWDSVQVSIQPLQGLLLAELRPLDQEPPMFLIFTASGELIYGENSDPGGARRVPLPGTPARELLDETMKALQQ